MIGFAIVFVVGVAILLMGYAINEAYVALCAQDEAEQMKRELLEQRDVVNAIKAEYEALREQLLSGIEKLDGERWNQPQ